MIHEENRVMSSAYGFKNGCTVLDFIRITDVQGHDLKMFRLTEKMRTERFQAQERLPRQTIVVYPSMITILYFPVQRSRKYK